jgi:hypothetical protein
MPAMIDYEAGPLCVACTGDADLMRFCRRCRGTRVDPDLAGALDLNRRAAKYREIPVPGDEPPGDDGAWQGVHLHREREFTSEALLVQLARWLRRSS